MLAYNLFRHKDDMGLYCAVPEDMPVPAFLTKDEWVYSYPIDHKALARFDAAAQSFTTANEIFLFQLNREAGSQAHAYGMHSDQIGN
jgi:hypothetical protein